MNEMLKKRIPAFLFLAFLCVSAAFAAELKASGEPLVVGIMPSAVGAPVQYAMENGYYDELGLKVEIMIFPSGAPINEAVSAGQLDVAASGAATIFSLASGDCILLADVESSGGMGIWVRPDNPIMKVKGQIPEFPEMHGSAETIKGQKFLANLGTASQFNVLRYVESFGLTEADIEIIHMDFGPGAQAFIAGEGDAIGTFAPYSFQVEEKGAVLCATFEDATRVALYDMIFTRNDVAEERRDDVVLFLRATERAIEALSDDNVRKDFSMRWFAENGRTYSDETMAQEMKDRRYVNKAQMEGDYVFGEAMEGYAQFNVSIGKIMEENLEYVSESLQPSFLEEAVGIAIKAPQK
jgi:ABC-type nitrate/sulfonate/bicarbonate transport system substrate-binding protein